MKKTWDREYRGIGIKWEEKMIHIDNDSFLETCMQEGRSQVYQLAEYIKDTYKAKYGDELHLSTKSLTIEIIMHYRLEKRFLRLKKYIGPNRLTDKIVSHTTIIDCGEKPKDRNRFIWDFMSKCLFFRKYKE